MTDKKEFGTDPELKKLLQVYLTIVVAGFSLSWMIPLVAGSLILYSPEIGVVAAVSCFAPLLVAAGFVLYWIQRFHSSINYVLAEDEIVVTKGVWWKTKSVVPYNRITNVNIYQGPISRHFGLGKLAIQTAGFSGVSSAGYKTAEAEIFGIKNSEEIKDVVMSFVKGRKPEAVEAGIKPMKDTNEQILEELRRIRKAVEK